MHPAGRAGRAGHVARSAACRWPSGRRARRRPCPRGSRPASQLAPFRVAQAGIKTAEVAYAPLTQTLTTVGYVAFDERRMANIVSKVPGKSRVEKLYVNFTGQDVEAGQPLAELYSPELNQAIQELLTAARRAEPDGPAADRRRPLAPGRSARAGPRCRPRSSSGGGSPRPRSTRSSRRARPTSSSRSSRRSAATCSRRTSSRARRCRKATRCSRSSTCSTVWVQAQVYEHQLGLVHEGQAVEATVEAFPGETFPGKVEFIQPHLDPATRTVEVRYRPGEPRPSAPARDVRHGDAEDPGRRHACLPVAGCRGDPHPGTRATRPA